jgi:hypothetical protein
MKTPYIVTVSNIGLGSGDYDAGPNAGTAAAEVEYLARKYPAARFTVKLPRGGVLLAARPSAIAGLAAAVRRSGVAS